MIALALLSLTASAGMADAEAIGGVLEQILSRALANNPSLRAQRERVLAAKQVAPQMRALPDPMAELEFMNLSVSHPSLEDALTEGISLGVTQTLPYPGKRAAAAAVALGEFEVERARLRAMEREVSASVSGAAYRYCLLQNLLALNGRTREALEAAAQTAAALYAAGTGTQAEILIAQSAATRALARGEELETRRRITAERLRSLLAGPFDESSLGELPLPVPAPIPPLNDLLDRLPETSPEILMGRAEEGVGEREIAVAKLASKPDFSAGGRYRFRDMTMGGGDYITAVFGVTLPFFHKKDRYQPALQEALHRREAARYGTQDALTRSRYRLSEAHERACRARRLYDLLQGGLVVQASQAYESSLAAYSVGKADFASLLMALTQAYETQGDVLVTQADYGEALADMEAALGAPVVPGAEASPSKAGALPQEYLGAGELHSPADSPVE